LFFSSGVEMKAPAPMVPLELFKSRSFLGANVVTLFLYAAIGVFFFLFSNEFDPGGKILDHGGWSRGLTHDLVDVFVVAMVWRIDQTVTAQGSL